MSRKKTHNIFKKKRSYSWYILVLGYVESLGTVTGISRAKDLEELECALEISGDKLDPFLLGNTFLSCCSFFDLLCHGFFEFCIFICLLNFE